MVAIRLRRAGSKKRPFFRVVVTDSRAARDSCFVEILGHYNPRTKPALVQVNKERVDYWMKQGRAAVRFGAHADRASPHARARAGARGDSGGGRRGQVSTEPGNDAATGVRAVVEVLARALTDRPDEVRVTESQHKQATLIELFVSPQDIPQGDRAAGADGGGAADARGDGRRTRRQAGHAGDTGEPIGDGEMADCRLQIGDWTVNAFNLQSICNLQ